MKRLAATALVVLWIALPACAQRFSAHGSPSGHNARASHRSPRAHARRRSSHSPRYTRSRFIAVPRRVNGIDVGAFSGRSTHVGLRRYRSSYQPSYARGTAYGVTGGPLPYFLAYPVVIGDSDSPAPQTTVAEGYGQQPDEHAWPAAPSSPTRIASVQSRQSVDLDSEDAVTLIFKDGRPPELIHNYILTRSTLYVGERHHPDIPVDQLDLVATAQVNRDAGIDFHLPDAHK
jgi:hypothetical protein